MAIAGAEALQRMAIAGAEALQRMAIAKAEALQRMAIAKAEALQRMAIAEMEVPQRMAIAEMEAPQRMAIAEVAVPAVMKRRLVSARRRKGMLDGFVQIYHEMKPMTENLKKKSYETNMENFRSAYGHYFEEMTAYVDAAGAEAAGNSSAAEEEVAANIIEQVKGAYTKWGKIWPATQFTINMFTIYYVFPSILMTDSPHAEELCQVLCRCWGKAFRDSTITYADYRTIYDSFKETILGFAIHRE